MIYTPMTGEVCHTGHGFIWKQPAAKAVERPFTASILAGWCVSLAEVYQVLLSGDVFTKFIFKNRHRDLLGMPK